MTTYRIEVLAATIAGGGVSFHEYETASADEAREAFWRDVNEYGLAIARVLSVCEEVQS